MKKFIADFIRCFTPISYQCNTILKILGHKGIYTDEYIKIHKTGDLLNVYVLTKTIKNVLTIETNWYNDDSVIKYNKGLWQKHLFHIYNEARNKDKKEKFSTADDKLFFMSCPDCEDTE